MVRQDHVGAVADEQAAIHFHAGFAQRGHFLEKGDGVEHHAVADDAAAARPQDAARHQLKNEFLSVDDDGVPGIVSAGIAGHDREILRENVHDLALAFVAPLRTDDDRSLTLLQSQLRGPGWRPPRPHCRVTHTPRPR